MKKNLTFQLPSTRQQMLQIAVKDFLEISYAEFQVINHDAEFNGIRAAMYKQAMKRYPNVRHEDIAAMFKHLNPQEHEIILEVGSGSGFFSNHIADSCKEAILSDPSSDQLKEFIKKPNTSIQVNTPEYVDLPDDFLDAIYTFGAMHHSNNKLGFLNNAYRMLKIGGRVVIGDVFSGSSLAKHFDEYVAQYSVTGHEVSFWSDEFAKSIATLAGFSSIEIINLPQRWWFESLENMADFMYLLHGMVYSTRESCLEGIKDTLGIGQKDGKYYANWPMKMIHLVK